MHKHKRSPMPASHGTLAIKPRFIIIDGNEWHLNRFWVDVNRIQVSIKPFNNAKSALYLGFYFDFRSILSTI